MNQSINQLNSFAESWSYLVWSSSWQAASLAIVLLVIVLLGRKLSAPVRYGILLVALVKFAMPPFLHVPSGVFSTVSVAQPSAVVDADQTLSSVIGTGSEAIIQEPVSGNRFAAGRTISSVTDPKTNSRGLEPSTAPMKFAATAGSGVATSGAAGTSLSSTDGRAQEPLAADSDRAGSPRAFLSLTGWAMLAHIFGSLILLIVLAVKQMKLSRLQRRASELDSQPIRKLFTDTCAQLNLRREPKLLVSNEIDAPISYGCWQPVVMLPVAMQQQTEHCSIVFAHELAHLKRLDPWFNGLQNLLFAIWWFNPLLWALNWQIRKIREDCCDDLVLANRFFSGEYYSRSLIEIAKFSNQQRSLTLQTAFSMAEHPLKDRIRRIMNPAAKRARKISWPGAMLVLILGLVCLPGIRSVIAGPSPTQNETAAENDLTVNSTLRENAAENNQVESKADPAQDAQETQSERSFKFKVIDEDRNPVVGAKIFCNVLGEKIVDDVSQPKIENETYPTDGNGIATIKLFKGASSIRTWTSNEAKVTMFTNWEDLSSDDVPEIFTLTLQQATSVGGKVIDDKGEPVADVRVEVRRAGGGDKLDSNKRAKLGTWLSNGDDAVRTDENGQWKINNVPAGDVKLGFKLTHPDYLADTSWQTATHFGVTLEQLRDESASFVVTKGLSITGKILDSQGQDVPDALIVWGDRPYWTGGSQETRSDENGMFVTQAFAPGEYRLTVVAKGWMPQTRMVRIDSDSNEAQDFLLKPGKKIHLKFVDSAGHPLPKTHVGVRRWRGAEALYNNRHSNVLNSKIPVRSNQEGEYIWDWAPDDEIELSFGNRKINAYLTRKITASDDVQLIVLKRPFRFNGSVVDAKSGELVEQFTITPISYWSKATSAQGITQDSWRKRCTKSEFDVDDVFHIDDWVQVAFRIEAIGFQTYTTQRFSIESPSEPIEIRLTPAVVTQANVVKASGQNVSDASAWLAVPNDSVIFNQSADYFDDRHAAVTTDATGNVQFSTPVTPFAVIAANADGYAEKYCQPGDAVGELTLQPWASLEGQLFQDGKPVADATIKVAPIRSLGGDNPHLQDSFSMSTDIEGRFRFDKLPPVPVTVSSILSSWEDYPITSNSIVPIELQPGKNHKVNLGGEGLKVVGKVKLSGQGSELIQYRYGINQLVSAKPPISLPDHVSSELRFEAGEQAKFEQRLWGEHGSRGRHSHIVKLNDDGTFLINGVEPGSYRFLIKLYEPPEGCLVDPVGYAFLEFSTDDYKANGGSIDLGEIDVKIRPIQKVGETLSDFKYKELDGTQKYLSGHRGKYVMLDFWATWCAPCVDSIADIKSLHEQLSSSQQAMLLSLSLDDEPAVVRELIEKESMEWSQGIVGDIQSDRAGKALGISSVPLYIVLDPQGKIISRTSVFEEASDSLLDALKSENE